jgi:hypothetical protein
LDSLKNKVQQQGYFMDQQVFESYLRQTQQTALRLSTDPSALLDIIQIIEKHKPLAGSHQTDWEEFFKGESAFYSGQYEKALQHYLAAKEVPHYHFFCFRTSCFVARARGNQDQAINFAKKALKLHPYDEILKQFLHDLNAVQASKPAETIPKISLGEREIAELASIFEESPQQHEELFSREFKEEKKLHQHFGAQSEELESSSQSALASIEDVPPISTSFAEETTTGHAVDVFSFTNVLLETDEERLAKKVHSSFQEGGIATETPLKALKRLAEEAFPLPSEPSIFSKSSDLESRIEAFQSSQSKRLQEYLNYTNTRPQVADNALFVLSGWDKNLPVEIDAPQQANTQGLILTEHTRKSSGGLFLRWNGQGIVINPGAGFINHFHEQGFSLQDIHAVIVTRDHYTAYADIKVISELNNKLNKMSGNLHIIHYYLNQKAYQELTTALKPNFKQARNTVHSLELFIDSPDVEKIEINENITLHYFLAAAHDSHYHAHAKGEPAFARTTLGIRLELRNANGEKTNTRLGYVSGASWSPILAHNLGVCDVLVAGFGNTAPNDYTKASYQEDSLGYHGSYSLLEEIAPRLFISTEFGGREGDIRLEAAKKLRHEIVSCGRRAPQESAVIPGDIGLYIDLKHFKIKCSITGEYVDSQNICIFKSADAFGRLLYLSPSCYL